VAASTQFCTRESVLVSKRTAPLCPSAHGSVASTCIAEVQPCARGCRAKNTLPAGVAVYEEATQQRREEVAPKTQKSNYFCQRRREQHTHRETGGSVKSPRRHRQAGHWSCCSEIGSFLWMSEPPSSLSSLNDVLYYQKRYKVSWYKSAWICVFYRYNFVNVTQQDEPWYLLVHRTKQSRDFELETKSGEKAALPAAAARKSEGKVIWGNRAHLPEAPEVAYDR